MDDPYIDNAPERSMDEQTRKALEPAKAAIFRMDIFGNEDETTAAIDAALSAPAAPVAHADLVEAVDRVLAEAPCECGERLRFDRGEHLSCCYLFDMNEARNRAANPAAPVAQSLPACHVAVIGDRWDSEKLHHVPQLLIEFEPVPANTGNTAKGWVDRDSLAKILNGIGQGGTA